MISSELSEKIKRIFKEETFIGNYIFAAEEWREITDFFIPYFQRLIQTPRLGLPERYYQMFFLIIVNITKEWSREKGSWFEYLCDRFIGEGRSDTEKRKFYGSITGAIDNFSKSNSIFSFSDGRYNYTTTVSHAFAPISSTTAFFDMAWNLYFETLGQDVLEDDPVFDMVRARLSKMMRDHGSAEDDNEDLKLGHQAYSLRAGIKKLVTNEPAIFTALLRDVVLSIDALFNDDEIGDGYLHSLLNNWWANKEKSLGKIRKRKDITRAARQYSEIKGRYALDSGDVILSIPPFILHESDDICPFINVYSNGKHIKSEYIDIEIGAVSRAQEYQLRLNDLRNVDLSSLRVEIIHDGQQVYDSEEELFRDFILFGENGREEKDETCQPGQYYLYDPYGCQTRVTKIAPTYDKTYSFIASDGDAIIGAYREIHFYFQTGDETYRFLCKREKKSYFLKGQERFEIVSEKVALELSKDEDERQYGLRFNEKIIRLIDLSKEMIGEKIRYDLLPYLEKGKGTVITLFTYASGKAVAGINLIYFPTLDIRFDRAWYYGVEGGTLSFINDKPFSKLFSISELIDDELHVAFNDGELVFPVPVVWFRFGNGDKHGGQIKNFIWYKDLTNSELMEVKVPQGLTYEIRMSGKGVLSSRMLDGRYEIGKEIRAMVDSQRFSRSSLNFLIDNQKFPMANFALKPQFAGDVLIIDKDNQRATFDPSTFIGDKSEIVEFKLSFFEKNNPKPLLAYTFPFMRKDFSLRDLELHECQITLEYVLKKVFYTETKTIFKMKTIQISHYPVYRFKGKQLVIVKYKKPSEDWEREFKKPSVIFAIKFIERKEYGPSFYSGVMRDYKGEEEPVWIKIIGKKCVIMNDGMKTPKFPAYEYFIFEETARNV